MMVAHKLMKVVQEWELPLEPEAEKHAVYAVQALGEQAGYEASDLARMLRKYTRKWQEADEVHPMLQEYIAEALRFVPKSINPFTATEYFSIYTKLREGSKRDVAGLSPIIAKRLLSRSALVIHLVKIERFSCSQVSRLLAATEESLDLSYGSVAAVAAGFGCLPTLNPDNAGERLWSKDKELSRTLFPDSSLSGSCEVAAEELGTWLPQVNMRKYLDILAGAADPSSPITWPYLQMLHWCLIPLEYFDHPPSFLYEFKPRGKLADRLFKRYPVATGNPILNNAKAVQTLSWSWARNRGGEDAHALVAVLEALDTLPFVPRRFVARLLRAWIARVIELRTVEPELIRGRFGDDLFKKFAWHVSENETNTAGVIEQRLVDCLSSLAINELYPHASWRSRGLGDPVNASNFSRKKLGDVEFACVDQRRAVAFEAHGGHLSKIYVDEHRRSLGRILEQRLEDSWLAIDDGSAWRVDIYFIAHSWEAIEKLAHDEIIHDVSVKYHYVSYRDLTHLALKGSSDSEREEAVQAYVIDKLNEPRVREYVRKRFREIVELPHSYDTTTVCEEG